MFSKVILKKTLEKFENVFKSPSNTKQMNIIQNTRIEIWRYKAVREYKI